VNKMERYGRQRSAGGMSREITLTGKCGRFRKALNGERICASEVVDYTKVSLT
jgi:hypothetical protein